MTNDKGKKKTMCPLWGISCNALECQVITDSAVTLLTAPRAGRFYWVGGGDNNENGHPSSSS